MLARARIPRASLTLVAIGALIAVGPSVAAADDAPAPETKDRSRPTSGALKGETDSWNTDANEARVNGFGTFTESIRLAVPRFQEIAPGLALTYRSSSANGWLGVGWNLDGVGHVERTSPGKGAPRYDSTDIYLLDGEELVPCIAGGASPSCLTSGTHSTKTESYLKIALTGTGTAARWTVTSKDGTKSVYAPVLVLPGTDGVAGTSDDLVAKWGLQTVTDTRNNVVTYSWGANLFGGAWDYLDSVTYNGTTIKLHYEQRPDIESSAIGRALSTVYGRLKTVDVSVSGSRVRAYKLGYTTSGATSRSLLTSVQQFGKNATLDASGTVTGGTSFPAITAGYPAASAATLSLASSDAGMGSSNDQRFLTMDVDGDGKTDMVEVWKTCTLSCSYQAGVWISNGVGFTKTSNVDVPAFAENAQFFAMDVNGDGKSDLVSLTTSGTQWRRKVFLSTGTTFSAGTTDTEMGYKVEKIETDEKDEVVTSRFVVGDIDGDGKTDMVELYPKTVGFLDTDYQRVTWISNGSGFTKASSHSGIPYEKRTQFFAVDFDGDGKSDILELKPGTGTTLIRRVWSSTSTGFALSVSDTSTFNANIKFLPMDVNGDGKTDLVELLPEGVGTRRKTFLSTGKSFSSSVSTWSAWSFGSARYVVTDVNGDGKSDYIAMTSNVVDVKRTVFRSDGTDFVQGQIDTLGNQGDHRYLAADVNGDGRTDMIELYDESLSTKTRRRVWGIDGPQPDLLTSFGGGFGGTTTVSYTPSSAWTNTNNPPIVQTASSVSVADGRGNASTTTYGYSGGKYDALEQRFLGFAYQKATHPCIAGEVACPYTETTFRQDYNTAGKRSRIDESDGSGKLLRSELIDYTTNAATVPWTGLPTGRWEYTYVNTGAACPGADCKRRYIGRTFSAYGEVSQEVDYGDYDVTGDEQTTTTAFVPNTSAYIVNLPADVKTFQGVGTAGALLTETVGYYDNATAWNVAPTVGLATKTARWLSSPSSFVETRSEYDAWGNVTATVNPLGARTTFAFDAVYHRFPTSTTNAILQVTATTWDALCGKPTQTTDLNGQITTVTYDALCRVSQKTSPGGKFETHSWVSLGDAANQYEQVDRPAADGTASAWFSRRYFDGLNRTWREVKKADVSTGNIFADTTFNARGEQASTTAPYYAGAAIYTTTYGYDALDRPTTTTFPGGAQQTTSYGLWSVTMVDELGHAKADRFDARANRVAHDEVIGGVTKTTSYLYDARQALQQSVDPSGNIVTYTTDSLGRRRTMVDPSSGSWSYEYDGANRLTAQVDPKNQRTELGYDALDRKTQKTTRAGTAQAVTVTWSYDEVRAGFHNKGRLTTVADTAGVRELDHDAAGRVVNSLRTIHGASYLFQYGFDAGDRPLWTTYPDGDTLGTPGAPLTYDSAGRLKAIPGYVTSATYDARNQATQIANANGTTTTRSYSPQRGWLMGVSTTGATTVQNLVFTRNDKGFVSQVTSPIGNEGWTFGYDDLDRVTSATNASSSANDQTLTYDALGNILTNSRLGTYSYGTRPHAVTTAGAAGTYVYDAAGLTTSGGGRTLTWDGDNRLATVTSGSTLSAFTYDADGERIQQVEGLVTRHYVGDDYEVDSLGKVTKYVSLGDLLVARKDGANKSWLHTDHLGSIQAETASSGAEVQRRKYRPYGEILSDSESLEYEPRGFTGERHDASGLVYLHARYYDPALGRFISPDSIVDGTDTVGLNRHAYVGNNPVNATDPTGLAAVVSSSQKNAGRAKDESQAPPPPPPPARAPSYPTDSAAPASAPSTPPPPPSPARAFSVEAKSNGTRATTASGSAPLSVGRASRGATTRPRPAARTGNTRGGDRKLDGAVQGLENRVPLPQDYTRGDYQACVDELSDIAFNNGGKVVLQPIFVMCMTMYPH